jgi:hypothetical protein
MMSTLFRKSILAAMVAALVLAALPVTTVLAADDPVTPRPEISNTRLERIWARQLRAFERLGRGFDRTDAFVEKVQARIDRAADNGRDVTGLQAALDAFEAAMKEAHPLYESTKGIVNSHKGFDEDGKVTEVEQARETIKEMGDALKEIRSAMGGTGRALHEALRAFREANRSTRTP